MGSVYWIGSTTTTTSTFSTSANWNGGSAPAANDDVIIPATNVCNIAAEDFSGTALSSFTVEDGSSITIGTCSTQGIASYLELDLGGTGTSVLDYWGSGECYLDIDNAAEINVHDSTAGTTAKKGLSVVGLDNDEVNVQCGARDSVGLGWREGDTFESDTVNVDEGEVYIGSGVTQKDGSSAITLNINGGEVWTKCPLGTVTMHGGTLHVIEGAVTTLTIYDATVYYRGTGTLTTAHVKPGGELNFDEEGVGSVTVTNTIELYKGATLRNNEGRADKAIKLNDCDFGDVTLALPPNKTWTPS